MPLGDEKQGFTRRLKESLKRAGLGARGATALAREFNLRYHGDPVTAQAVRKWLEGSALPSQDKVRTLARWLDVSAQWLRFGEGERRDERGAQVLKQEAAAYRVEPTWPTRKFDALNDTHKAMVMEIIAALLRLEGKQ